MSLLLRNYTQPGSLQTSMSSHTYTLYVKFYVFAIIIDVLGV